MLEDASVISAIIEKRAALSPERALLVGISGIDAAGKGFVAARIAESLVKRGENSGRKLHHDFVVLQFAKIDMLNEGNRWTGTVSLSTKAETDKPTALAAWIKSDGTAPPIQATGGWLKP